MKQKEASSPHENKYKSYIISIGLTSAISWTAWALVINKLDPYETTGMGLILFFISLLFALIGTFTLLGFGLRQWMGEKEISYHHLSVSLRQGSLLSLCTIVCIGFLILGILKWWNGLLVVTIAILIEMLITRR